MVICESDHWVGAKIHVGQLVLSVLAFYVGALGSRLFGAQLAVGTFLPTSLTDLSPRLCCRSRQILPAGFFVACLYYSFSDEHGADALDFAFVACGLLAVVFSRASARSKTEVSQSSVV